MPQIVCPKCKVEPNKVLEKGNFKILKCKCSEYPIYNNITYLIDDPNRKHIIDLIRSNHTILAAKAFLNLPYRVFIPLYFITQSKIAYLLGFDNTIRFVKIFGFDSSWGEYLIKRKEIPYYDISKLSINLGKNGGNVLDIGCGAGNLFPLIYKTLKPKNLIGIDLSPLNLFFAKYFFNNNNLQLICSNVETGLPFTSNYFNLIHMSDTLQYIKNKKQIIDEIGRISNDTGIISIPHTHEKSIKNKLIIGINKKLIKKYFIESGFKNTIIANDNDLLINSDLENFDRINEGDAFSVIASRNFLSNVSSFKKLKIIFIQPHLDDSILSNSFFIEKLKQAHIDINIITVFTRGGGKPYSEQADNFLKLSGFNNANSLYTKFKKEDAQAMSKIGLNVNHFNFIDAAFRKNRYNHSIYNNAKEQFSGNISRQDKALIKKISLKVRKYIRNFENVIFICPLGVGGHADHIITREAINLIKKPTLYYEEYPYNSHSENIRGFFSKNNKYKFMLKITNNNLTLKQNLIRIYKSQLPVLFPNNNIVDLDEKYYILQTK